MNKVLLILIFLFISFEIKSKSQKLILECFKTEGKVITKGSTGQLSETSLPLSQYGDFFELDTKTKKLKKGCPPENECSYEERVKYYSTVDEMNNYTLKTYVVNMFGLKTDSYTSSTVNLKTGNYSFESFNDSDRYNGYWRVLANGYCIKY